MYLKYIFSIITFKVEHICFIQASKVRFDSKLEEKRAMKGSQSSTILEFIKVGVKN